jgi:flagellar basal-body rod protein FlgC
VSIDAIGSAASGLSAAIQQLNASANNLANLQTTKPMDGAAFQGDQLLLGEGPDGGVSVLGTTPAGTEQGIPVSQPENPQADGSGFVRLPDIDVAGEMVNMMTAQGAVTSNVVVVNRAVDAYRDLLAMTKSDRDRSAAAPVSL